MLRNASSRAKSVLAQHLETLSVVTRGEGFTDLTGQLNGLIATSGLQLGLLNLTSLHTSCSLTINENADPQVRVDLTAHLQALAPVEGIRPVSGLGQLRPYGHADEGPDDMPAHIRTALTCTHLGLSFRQGRLLLGTWQAVYLWEHRRLGSRRQLAVHLLGE
jgi:secondary thiamine-phosphate synthase enzyme